MSKKASLYISGIEVPVLRDTPIPFTFTIEDVRNPDKTNVSQAMTIELPSTPELDKIFEFIYQPEISLQYFNPNFKTEVEYRVNNTTVFAGNLKLVKCLHDMDKNVVKYICDFIGQKANLFYAIGENYLYGNDNPANDIDMSKYDHLLTLTNVTDSWTLLNVVNGVAGTAVLAGQGYRYGRANYGYNGEDNYNMPIYGMRPCFFYREVLAKIFEVAGATWTSTFLDSSFFKTIVFPCPNILKLSESDYNNALVFAAMTPGSGHDEIPTPQPTMAVTGTTGASHPFGAGYSLWAMSGSSGGVVEFVDDTNLPFSDAGGQYNPATGVSTIAVKGKYKVSANILWQFIITNTTAINGPATDRPYASYELHIIIKVNGVMVEEVIHQAADTTYFSTNQLFATALEKILILNVGDLVTIEVDYAIYDLIFLNNLGNNISTGQGNVSFQVSSFNAKPENVSSVKIELNPENDIQEGFMVEANQCLPKNFKMKDFIKAVSQMFNLYIYEDKNLANNYFIEPEKDFFNGTTRDWTSKVDITEPIETLIMSELDAKKYILKFADDNDYYNKRYKDNWLRNYGEKHFVVDSQFLVSENRMEVPIAPTPMVNDFTTNNIMPVIYQKGTEIEPIGFKLRALFWKGTSGIVSWNIVTFTGDNLQTYSPYIGTLDDPTSPLFDLNYAVPNEIFYNLTYLSATYTTNNLSSVYWKPFFDRINDKDTKIIRIYIRLDEADVKAFDFREPVLINGVKLRANVIQDFDAQSDKTTLVEFIKV